MDEVDAFLDLANVQLMATYLRNMKSKTQFLIVTHKEDLAQNTDSLVGVCMLKQHSTSKTYSLNLQEFA
jgi:chromosome segregation protein